MVFKGLRAQPIEVVVMVIHSDKKATGSTQHATTLTDYQKMKLATPVKDCQFYADLNVTNKVGKLPFFPSLIDKTR